MPGRSVSRATTRSTPSRTSAQPLAIDDTESDGALAAVPSRGRPCSGAAVDARRLPGPGAKLGSVATEDERCGGIVPQPVVRSRPACDTWSWEW